MPGAQQSKRRARIFIAWGGCLAGVAETALPPTHALYTSPTTHCQSHGCSRSGADIGEGAHGKHGRATSAPSAAIITEVVPCDPRGDAVWGGNEMDEVKDGEKKRR